MSRTIGLAGGRELFGKSFSILDCAATVALLLIDLHDSSLRVLADRTFWAGYHTVRFTAVLAWDNPSVQRQIREDPPAPALHSQVMRKLVRQGRLIINDLVVISASNDACPASDAAVQVDH
jgi:hypothetical protein